MEQEIVDLQRRLTELESRHKNHSHDGAINTRSNLDDIQGMFQSTGTVPSFTPVRVSDQLRIYKSGGNPILYWYDKDNQTWGHSDQLNPGSGSALTASNDTNVTLTLGGTPTTALVTAASLTLGWTGQLSPARGGTGASNTATSGTLLQGNGTNFVTSSSTWPTTITTNQVLYATGTNAVGSSANLTFDGGRVNLLNSGTLLWAIDSTGSMVLSDDGSVNPSTTTAINVRRTLTNTSNPSVPIALNFQTTVTQDSTSLGTGITSQITGNYNPTTTAGTSYTIGSAYAILGQALYRGAMTDNTVVGITNQIGGAFRVGTNGTAPVGQITSGISLNIPSLSYQHSGTPSVFFVKQQGIVVGNQASLTTGVTMQDAQGIAIATQTGASRSNYDIQIGGTSVPVAGNFSILQSSTTQNAIKGNTYFGNTTAATAKIHVAAGTATASTAPLKFTSGTLLTTAEAGAVEFLTDKYYATITTSAARKELALVDAALTSGRIPYTTTNGRLIDTSLLTFNGTQLTTALGTVTDVISHQFSRTVTDAASSTHATLRVGTTDNAPSADTAGAYASLWVTSQTPASSTANFSGSPALLGSFYEATHRGSGTMNVMGAMQANVVQSAGAGDVTLSRTINSNIAMAGTATTVIGFDSNIQVNNAVGAVTTFIGLRQVAMGTITAGGAVSNAFGAQINNLGKTGVDKAAGIAINNQASAATSNVNLLIGTTTIPSGTYSLYNSSTNQNVHAGRTFFGGTTTPTAVVHLAAGTASANTAPLKLTSGTNLTTAETGAIEYNGTNLFFTRTGTTRESVITANAVNTVSPTSPNRTVTVVIDGTTYYIAAKTTND